MEGRDPSLENQQVSHWPHARHPRRGGCGRGPDIPPVSWARQGEGCRIIKRQYREKNREGRTEKQVELFQRRPPQKVQERVQGWLMGSTGLPAGSFQGHGD